jgi:hypothetical protein
VRNLLEQAKKSEEDIEADFLKSQLLPNQQFFLKTTPMKTAAEHQGKYGVTS